MADQPSDMCPSGPFNKEPTSNPLISNERVAVQVGFITAGAAEILVRIPAGASRITSGYPGSASLVVRRYPEIVRHRCHAGSAHGIRAELANTEVAHLLEHLVIEVLAREGTPRGQLHGATAWNFSADGQGVYRVRISGARTDEELGRAVLEAVDLISQFTKE